MTRGLLALAVAGLLLLSGALGAASSDWFRDRDFSSLYHGARLVTGIDVYDEVAWCREARGSTFGAVDERGREVCPAVFLYPLWTAVALLPLGLLPLETAASLWLALSIAATLLGVRWCWLAVRGSPRAAPLLFALVVGSEPFWLMVSGGQIGGMLLLGLGLGAWLLSRARSAGAGATLAILALKPHVLALAAAALLGRAALARERAFLAGAFGATAALLLISLPFRPAWPFQWLAETFGRQTGYSPSLATAWGMAARDLGAPALAPVLIAVLLVAVLALARGVPREPVAFTALAVPLALFATPYAWSYDFVVLALPWAFVLARAERLASGMRRALMGTLAIIASPLSWALYVLAFAREAETLSALIPAASALLVAWAHRVSSPESGSSPGPVLPGSRPSAPAAPGG